MFRGWHARKEGKGLYSYQTRFGFSTNEPVPSYQSIWEPILKNSEIKAQRVWGGENALKRRRKSESLRVREA